MDTSESTNRKPNMPVPPPKHFFRIKFSYMLTVPVMWVQLRRKMWFGSILIDRMWEYVEGESDMSAEAEHLGLSLISRYLTDRLTSTKFSNGISTIEGDYQK